MTMRDKIATILWDYVSRGSEAETAADAMIAALPNYDAQQARIAELEATLQQERSAKWTLLESPLKNRVLELEAKLAKAMKLMELSVELATWNTTLLEDVIDFIAELKGQTDE